MLEIFNFGLVSLMSALLGYLVCVSKKSVITEESILLYKSRVHDLMNELYDLKERFLTIEDVVDVTIVNLDKTK